MYVCVCIYIERDTLWRPASVTHARVYLLSFQQPTFQTKAHVNDLSAAHVVMFVVMETRLDFTHVRVSLSFQQPTCQKLTKTQ